MASNLDRAVEVLNKHWSVAQETQQDDEAACCAQALADEGLLMPDLPEPDLDHRDPAHRTEHQAWWEGPVPDVWNQNLPDGFTVQFFSDKPEVVLYFDLEPYEPFSLEEARRLAHVLLAAANHAERENQA